MSRFFLTTFTLLAVVAIGTQENQRKRKSDSQRQLRADAFDKRWKQEGQELVFGGAEDDLIRQLKIVKNRNGSHSCDGMLGTARNKPNNQKLQEEDKLHYDPRSLSNITEEDYTDILDIYGDRTLTKEEMQLKINKWVNAQGSELSGQFKKIKEMRENFKTAVKLKIVEILLNVKTLNEKAAAIKDNKKITRAKEKEEIKALYAMYPRSVIKIINVLKKAAKREVLNIYIQNKTAID